ncbi:formylglycine-generating enzyme family protein [Sulfidibacter corallicola]|nr:formylglycine-generating enzyme family protein [Sulfidibacter corallicola]
MIQPCVLRPPSDFPYRWTAAYGQDVYGIWQTIVFRDVPQSYRWIPPGTFTMGSPEEEHCRGNYEAQRRVTLSQGFWMADTACTQALWSAVMAENPSHFKGEMLPVESVTFDRVTAFLEKWRDMCPEVPLRLPTEAEWEYACRANTQTPFCFGETISTDQVNFDGRYPYRSSDAKGAFREKTIPVKEVPPNGWGLYQMHGNVWEWCADWYGPYDEESMLDPTGPDSGHERVFRGGGWISDARYCRSASRIAYGPGFVWLDSGFRLVSGHGDLEEKAERPGEHPRSGGGQVAGTDTGQASRRARRQR